MRKGLRYTSIGILKDFLYVIGGMNHKHTASEECLRINTQNIKKWEQVQPLQSAIFGATAVTNKWKEQIWVLGGIDRS